MDHPPFPVPLRNLICPHTSLSNRRHSQDKPLKRKLTQIQYVWPWTQDVVFEGHPHFTSIPSASVLKTSTSPTPPHFFASWCENEPFTWECKWLVFQFILYLIIWCDSIIKFIVFVWILEENDELCCHSKLKVLFTWVQCPIYQEKEKGSKDFGFYQI